jgi:hypothetical protein
MFAPRMHPTEATTASHDATTGAPTPARHRYWPPRAMPWLLPPSRLSAVETPMDHEHQQASLAETAALNLTPSRSWHLGMMQVAAPNQGSQAERLFPRVQPKMVIGAANDPLEHEADRVADRIMRMPGTGAMGDLDSASQRVVQRTCASCDQRNDVEDAVRRQAIEPDLKRQESPPDTRQESNPLAASSSLGTEKDEIRERLIRSYLQDTETLQRQAEPREDDETAADEQILMRSQPVGVQPRPYAEGLEPAIRSLEGGGQPLPTAIRQYMEPRFGHNFSSVRIHTDRRASDMAGLANARAFTSGRNVVFASGEYAPSGSVESLRLLAHELTHVVQQGQASGRVQRKIVVGGKPYAPSARYLTWLTVNFGPAMREFVEHMHNGGSPPVYSFSSLEQMGFEVRTRAAAIKGIEDVHKGCCDYFSNADPPHLDSTFWQQIGGGVHFVPKSPLPGGKNASDAIEAIFAPGAHTRLECLSMTIAIEYRAMLKSIGAARFNAKFPGGAGIDISTQPPLPLVSGPDKKFEIKAVASKSEILPGDWVYFKNFHDYPTRVPHGAWQGENAIALGGGMFRGFGVAAMSESGLNQELVNRYNNDATPIMSKTVADLIADGGGLLLDPVARPVISKIAP